MSPSLHWCQVNFELLVSPREFEVYLGEVAIPSLVSGQFRGQQILLIKVMSDSSKGRHPFTGVRSISRTDLQKCLRLMKIMKKVAIPSLVSGQFRGGVKQDLDKKD